MLPIFSKKTGLLVQNINQNKLKWHKSRHYIALYYLFHQWFSRCCGHKLWSCRQMLDTCMFWILSKLRARNCLSICFELLTLFCIRRKYKDFSLINHPDKLTKTKTNFFLRFILGYVYIFLHLAMLVSHRKLYHPDTFHVVFKAKSP